MKKFNLIKIVVAAIVVALNLSLMFACSKDNNDTTNAKNTQNVEEVNNQDEEEIEDSILEFKGIVFGEEMCWGNSIGYLIELETPINVGKRVFYGPKERQNVVKAYNDIAKFKIPDEIIKNVTAKDEITVEGLFHLPEVQPSRVCTAMYPVFDVPEVIIDTVFTSNSNR
ncbi:MAG: hypothetical protein WBH98_07050 [Bacteroidales bacterium]